MSPPWQNAWGLARNPAYLGTSLVLAFVLALAIGIPTDVVANPWFRRMTPVRPLDYFFLITISLATALLLASYRLPLGQDRVGAQGLTSGLLGYLAIGCPICNKLIVALLGVSGALSYFAPLQPFLGLLALAFAAVALLLRFRRLGQACPLPAPGPLAEPTKGEI